ncbi:Holliday junction branch migration protein RuvA [Comamonas thiooxydans]|uniref:Holliday junction branch migration protein RuvA n=1 Tax=Comamonas thiooxydans TaxID=363952 RepID=UPI000B4225BB|nr:Holliday junction branch migration protein RuvA [Comamonas thiooxydans]
MIGKITGLILAKLPPQVLLDVGGVAYEVDVPMSIFFELPAIGATQGLVTHLEVKEDSHKLYGFRTHTERAAFRELLKVTGIGCRSALSIMSAMTVNEIATAIAQQDPSRLVKAPGIGKKTAERLLLDLRGKFEKIVEVPNQAAADTDLDRTSIKDSLLALGYSEKEAVAALKQVAVGTSVVDGIRVALKVLSR